MQFLITVALLGWGFVSLWFFSRMRAPQAVIMSVLVGTLVLPEHQAVDLPALPPFDKTSVIALWCLVGSWWKMPQRLQAAKVYRGVDLLFVVILIGNVITAVTNPDPLVTGPVVRPGNTLYDGVSMGIKDTLGIFLPFFIGRAMLKKSRDLRDLTRIFVAGTLIYTIPMLWEVRMSPQLNLWVYGYYQFDFGMSMRYGGYRPIVFMETGMATSMLVLTAALFAAARWRAKLEPLWKWVYLAVVLFLAKSTGAIIYGLLFIPAVARAKKPRAFIPAAFALLFLFYPQLRAADLFPVDALVENAKALNEERAMSLWFRFDQEGQLLERGRERFWFGWGGYDRNRIFDSQGEDLSVTDGDWAIQLGTKGLVGFIGMYGLLAWPLLMLPFRLRKLRDKRDRMMLGALGLACGLLCVDLLPNGLFNCLPFFFAGAISGLSTGMLAEQQKKRRLARQKARLARIRALQEAGYRDPSLEPAPPMAGSAYPAY